MGHAGNSVKGTKPWVRLTRAVEEYGLNCQTLNSWCRAKRFPAKQVWILGRAKPEWIIERQGMEAFLATRQYANPEEVDV